ncbi:MAG TPA: glutathione S-transferase family protein [Polyangiaceae bacterium]|nr:glutathione S-transferase family protein [Polyangiaceae bacterium]
MLKVHHARRARSVRVVWTLEELGVQYELVALKFSAEELSSPAYKKLHPLGLVPVIQEGDKTIFESGAIVQYILEEYGEGRLAPAPRTALRATYLQWFHFGETEVARFVSEIVRNRFGKPPEQRLEAVVVESRQRLGDSLAVVDGELAGKPYIVGEDFTAADIMVSYGITMARIIGELPKELTNVGAYLERLKGRPAYARAWA